jgi:hypothetical protein
VQDDLDDGRDGTNGAAERFNTDPDEPATNLLKFTFASAKSFRLSSAAGAMSFTKLSFSLL